MKGRAEAHGHVTKRSKEKEKRAPVVGVDHTHAYSVLEKQEETGTLTLVMQDACATRIMAKAVEKKGFVGYAVGVAKKIIEQLG